MCPGPDGSPLWGPQPWAATHVLTLGSGWGRTSSDGTLVSKRKPLIHAATHSKSTGRAEEGLRFNSVSISSFVSNPRTLAQESINS